MINPKSQIQNLKFHWLLLLLWSAIGIGLRFTHLASKSPWTDEFSTLVFSLGNSFRTVALDRAIALDTLLQPLQANSALGASEVVQTLLSETNHPPLYFVLAHWWMDLFPSDNGLVSLWVARSFPALLGAASIPAIFGLGVLAFRSRLVGHLAAAMMAVSPYGIFLAQEARHYTLAILWVIASLCCLIIAVKNIQQQKPIPIWIAFIWVAINTLGIATHYFFALTLCAQAIVLIIWGIGKTGVIAVCRRIRYTFVCIAAGVIAVCRRIRYTFVCIAAPLRVPLYKRSQKAFLDSLAIRCKFILSPAHPHTVRRSTERSRRSLTLTAEACTPAIFLKHWWRIYAVVAGTLAGGLIWLPLIQHGYDSKLTEWIKNSDRMGIEWIAPIFQAIAAWITMLSLLPVESSQLPIAIVSGLVMIVFFIWGLPILGSGVKVILQQSRSRIGIQILGGFVLSAIAIFFIITYCLGIDLTRGARYNFVYFPAVIVLVGASLAVPWRQSILEKSGYTPGFRGKKAVALILLMGLVSGITVVCNLGYQKYYRPDLLVSLIKQESQIPALIATTHKTHVQTGEIMGIAWELKRKFGKNLAAIPQFLLAHQEYKGSKTATVTLEKTLSKMNRPLNLWLVNFHAPVELEAQNCLADSQAKPSVDGYEYQLYRCLELSDRNSDSRHNQS
ncbi:MAG TPA: glycosyltransferase [Cyanobacteria bacterium UBA11368]|nr:glycosyltransferase [Cyanobacteria bacterium UBA11368]